jgi:LysM repeat protein
MRSHYFIVPLALLHTTWVSAARIQRRQDGPVPSGTIKDCTYFVDANAGDTCASIASDWGITNAQFLNYNPSVKSDCSGLVVGDSYCVEENYGKGPESTSATPTTSPTTTASSVPSPTQSNLVSNCQRFYLVKDGDTCGGIVNNYHEFSLQDFYSWNPSVGDQCQSLIAGYYVCIGVPGTPTTPVTTPAPKTTGVSPTQTGIASDCTKYYEAQSGDSCYSIVQSFGEFSQDDFFKWNPSVGSDCSGLYAGYYYCVAVPGTPTTRTSVSPTVTSSPTGPSPTQSGIISSCTKYYKAVSGDSCSKISDSFGTFSVADFEKWNPAVGADCGQLYAGYYYCVAVPGTPTSKTSASPTSTPTGPSPTQSGIISSCTKFYKAVSDDSCSKISDSFGTFSVADFEKWNPAVKSDCSQLYAGYYYCVAVPGTPTARTTSATPSPTTHGPQPQQSGIVSNCNKYYKVVSGDSCYNIEQSYHISSNQFFSWNKGLKTDCSNLFAGYYVCVGVS